MANDPGRLDGEPTRASAAGAAPGGGPAPDAPGGAGSSAPGGAGPTVLGRRRAGPPLVRVDDYAEDGIRPPEAWARDELWSALFEQAPMPYALYHIETRRVLANKMCAELFGYVHRPLAWFPSGSLGHPDDRHHSEAVLAEVVRGTAGPVSFDKRYRRSDGSILQAHINASVVRDERGDAWGVLLAFEDITDRRAAEQALAESESRLRALVANASDAIVVFDDKGNVIWASPSTEHLIGESVETHLGSNIISWAHPDDRPVAVEIFVATLAAPGQVTGPLRIRMRRSDGGTRYVETVATNLIDDPAVGGIVLNVRDLTDAEEAVSARELTEQRYRRMLENISDTVTLLDRDGRIILTTGNLRPVLGYPVDFWEGLDGFELVHPDDLEMAADTFQRLLARPGSENTGEVRVRRPDGSYRDVEMSAVNLLETPDVEAIVVTSRDVTDRNLAQRELADARDRAVKALQERTQFIAHVSHELRTPIHGILGLSELLATTDLDDDARTLARSITRATDSLRMVLDDILDFSKMEVGRLEMTDESIDVEQMASDIDALFQPQARAKGITLTAEIERGFPRHVRGDALRIRQVLHNLVNNAVKFTADGGVTVAVRRVPGRFPMARIAVRDTGIGIPSEAHRRIFEPFSQAYGETGREYGGTGLGLAIAKRLVGLMGGEIGFTSDVGRGSEFWFTMPLVETAAGPHVETSGPGPEQAEAGRRVLVVEDNPINQLLVRRQLTRLGYEPVVVASGDAALDIFPGCGADVVLMDWQLPGIDGLETTRRLRAWERATGAHRTPVVAMTASALPGDRDRCLAAGMDDFIAKPVSIGTLGAAVRRWAGSADDARSPGPAEDEPVVDPRALDVLTEELDDPALVATVVRTFLRELPGRVEWITAACADRDPVRLELMTHTLRSTSNAVGARGLAAACEELERTARDGGDTGLWDSEPLCGAAEAVAEALGRRVGPNPADDGPGVARAEPFDPVGGVPGGVPSA